MSAPPKALRCAIYTRKSSEEGLEQGFNSLDAQREACEAYIKSQAHEGWSLVPTLYDDGGFSGGTLERPAIKQLLADIVAKRVQVVVVYKVDRLTRSLADFARIVETFDEHGASFVSVTQQFNTTSSMGRLTLNVLLSFAQFEREVTGERIRDKIAASKKKGLWMGGSVPLGYDPKGRTLVVVPEEAERVRYIYERYLALPSTEELLKELRDKKIYSKCRITKSGRRTGGLSWSRGALYQLLHNPLYIGQIRHRKATYAGLHEAIVDRSLWDRVQEKLRINASRRRGTSSTESGYLLAGKLYDNIGNRMSPTYARKKDGRQYRYYTSQAVRYGQDDKGIEIPRIAADHLERLVVDAVRRSAEHLGAGDVTKVVLGRRRLAIEIVEREIANLHETVSRTIAVDVQLQRRKHEVELIQATGAAHHATAHLDRALIRALVNAHRWRAMIESGECKSIEDVGRRECVNATHVGRLLPLAFMAPDITDTMLEGGQSASFALENVRSMDIPMDWEGQRRALRGDLRQ